MSTASINNRHVGRSIVGFGARGLVLVVIASLCGCQLGKNEVVFVTNTSIGLDFDAKPPTLSIGYNRFEGVLQPQLENGQVLPVLSTINATANLALFGSGHSFATGAPSVIFGEMFTSSERYFEESDKTARELLRPGQIFTPPTSLTGKIRGDTIVASKDSWEKRNRVFFTTVTKLALDVEFDSGAGGFPTAINIGYKRKEFAYAPLVAQNITINNVDYIAVTVPALLATAAARTSVAPLVANQSNTGVQVNQTFATGGAATYLASHPGVRSALGPALIEDFEKAKLAEEKAAKEYDDATAQQKKYRDQVLAVFDNVNTDDAKRIRIFNEALALGLMKPDAAAIVDANKPGAFKSNFNAVTGKKENTPQLEALVNKVNSLP